MTDLLALGVWVPILDGDARAAEIYARHYASDKSRARRLERGTMLIMGPGQKLLLTTPCRRALFAWRKFIDDSGQDGVNCAVFANFGAGLSSDLIRAADDIAIESARPQNATDLESLGQLQHALFCFRTDFGA